jgi:hypothetical protein
MKSLFVTLLILAAGFLAYDYFLAAPWQRLVFEKGPAPAARVAVVPDAEVGAEVPSAPTMAPKSASDDYVPTVPGLPERNFVPPKLASLEELTGNWTVVPGHAFPRPIKLHRAVDVKMTAGSARIPEGATAYAYAVENGMVTVGPTETSKARGAVALSDTDLQEQLKQSYEKWKIARVEMARNSWRARKTAKAGKNVLVNEPVNLAGALDATGKPMQANDGTYPLLLASMKAGDVTDITQPRVRRWGQAESKIVSGQPVWTVDVWYETMAFSGPMEARAQAHVRNGRVVAWIYPGSGEPVP